MANKHSYQIVGRYMSGKEVTAYHLHDLSDGKSGKYSKDAVCLLIGKGQITNCSAQIYQGKVVLRGEGISLDNLPTKQENGDLTKTDSIGKIRRGTTTADAMTQLMLTKVIVNGRNILGYVVANAGGGTSNIPRQQVFELAKAGRIGNARFQESNGRPILRGVGINLNDLPTINAAELGINTPSTSPITKTNQGVSSKTRELRDAALAKVNITQIKGVYVGCVKEALGKIRSHRPNEYPSPEILDSLNNSLDNSLSAILTTVMSLNDGHLTNLVSIVSEACTDKAAIEHYSKSGILFVFRLGIKGVNNSGVINFVIKYSNNRIVSAICDDSITSSNISELYKGRVNSLLKSKLENILN